MTNIQHQTLNQTCIDIIAGTWNTSANTTEQHQTKSVSKVTVFNCFDWISQTEIMKTQQKKRTLHDDT